MKIIGGELHFQDFRVLEVKTKELGLLFEANSITMA